MTECRLSSSSARRWSGADVPHRFALICDLNAEWTQLVRAPGRARPGLGGAAPGARRVAGVYRMCLPRSGADPDAVFAALLTEAAAGQPSPHGSSCRRCWARSCGWPRPIPTSASTNSCPRCGAASGPTRWLDDRHASRPTSRWTPARTRSPAAGGTAANRASDRSPSPPGSTPAPTSRREALDHTEEEALVEARRVHRSGSGDRADRRRHHVCPADCVSRRCDQPGRCLAHDTTPAMVRYRCSQALRRMAQHAAAINAAA